MWGKGFTSKSALFLLYVYEYMKIDHYVSCTVHIVVCVCMCSVCVGYLCMLLKYSQLNKVNKLHMI